MENSRNRKMLLYKVLLVVQRSDAKQNSYDTRCTARSRCGEHAPVVASSDALPLRQSRGYIPLSFATSEQGACAKDFNHHVFVGWWSDARLAISVQGTLVCVGSGKCGVLRASVMHLDIRGIQPPLNFRAARFMSLSCTWFLCSTLN